MVFVEGAMPPLPNVPISESPAILKAAIDGKIASSPDSNATQYNSNRKKRLTFV